MRRVGERAVARAGRAGLGAVDLDLGGVEIDRRLRLRIAPKRPVKATRTGASCWQRSTSTRWFSVLRSFEWLAHRSGEAIVSPVQHR